MFLNELAERRVVVIFCGRFQPFHRGHAIVYNNLVSTYGRNNVYIGTSGLVKPPDSPFTLSDRIYFMNLMGIPSDRVLQLSNNYNPAVVAEALGIQDLSNTVMIFPVSQKDVDEKPSLFAGGYKKDGTLAKLQPLPKDQNQVESADKHAYIQIVNVEPFKVLGQTITGATSIRDQYIKSDTPHRQQIIKDLYGKYTHEAEQIMNHALDAPVVVPAPKVGNKTKLQKVKMPKEEPVVECGGTGVIANKKQANDPRYKTSLTRDVRPGQIGKSLRAFNLAEQDETDRRWAQIQQLNSIIDEIAHRITTERLPAEYVQALKQRVEKLKAERVDIALGRK